MGATASYHHRIASLGFLVLGFVAAAQAQNDAAYNDCLGINYNTTACGDNIVGNPVSQDKQQNSRRALFGGSSTPITLIGSVSILIIVMFVVRFAYLWRMSRLHRNGGRLRPSQLIINPLSARHIPPHTHPPMGTSASCFTASSSARSTHTHSTSLHVQYAAVLLTSCCTSGLLPLE